MLADDRGLSQDVPEDDPDELAPDEWDAYPVIVVVILLAVVQTVLLLGPWLGGALSSGAAHH